MKKSLAEVLAENINKNVIINQTNQDDSTQEGEIIQINDEELDHLISAHKDVYEYQLFKRKILENKLNHSNFYELIAFYERKLKESELSVRDDIHKELYVNLNRVFTNFTASLKSFIDDFLIKKHLPKIYGKESKELEIFKKQTNIWYDTIFSYKFLMRIRDYAIHYDFPIFSVAPVYDLDKQTGKILNIKINSFFNKEKLLKNSTLKSKLESDLKTYNIIFPVSPILEKIIPVLDQIESILISLSDGRYEESAKIILSFYNKFSSPKSVLFGKVPVSEEFSATKLEYELSQEILEH